MIAVPILITIVTALCNWPHHSNDGEEHLEESHWMRIRNRLRTGPGAGRGRKQQSRIVRWIRCQPDEEQGAALEDHTVAAPADEAPQPLGPSMQVFPTARPIDRRASMRSVVPDMPISDIGLIQTRNPPSGSVFPGTRAPFFPQMPGGAMGGGTSVHPQSTAAHPGPRMSVAPVDLGRSRHASRASRARVRVDTAINENIPLAMPVRTSRQGRPTSRSQRESHSEPPCARRTDAIRVSSREGQNVGQYRASQVTNLLSSLREGRRAPQNAEWDDQQRRSPSMDGPNDDRPIRPPHPYELPLDFMRRARAMNQVIQTTQDFIRGYPDMACLIGQLPDVAVLPPSSDRRRRRKARTMHL